MEPLNNFSHFLHKNEQQMYFALTYLKNPIQLYVTIIKIK